MANPQNDRSDNNLLGDANSKKDSPSSDFLQTGKYAENQLIATLQQHKTGLMDALASSTWFNSRFFDNF